MNLKMVAVECPDCATPMSRQAGVIYHCSNCANFHKLVKFEMVCEFEDADFGDVQLAMAKEFPDFFGI